MKIALPRRGSISGQHVFDRRLYNQGDGDDTIIEMWAGNFSTIDTLVLHVLVPTDVSSVGNRNDCSTIL
jgi:hypothetical protein